MLTDTTGTPRCGPRLCSCRTPSEEERFEDGSHENQEDAGADNHHDLLLEILLIARNVLIINTNWNGKMTKETK